MTEPYQQDELPAAVDHLQEVRPVVAMQGHEMCADIHTALAVTQAVLTSRNRRVAEQPEAESSETILREVRALGIEAAAPQLIAMVALVDSAVSQLADSGAMSEDDAWEQLRKDVLRKHCQSPDSL
jgi:hypothetical protein